MGPGFPLDHAHSGASAISGIDEAGRGCLAGPVVIARVTWTPAHLVGLPWFASLADSKTISQATRAMLFPHILRVAKATRIAVISHIAIDALNILRATLHGFELVAPPPDPEVPLLIDGNQKPPSLHWARTEVKGDSRSSAMAAAGVLAKVTRDALMIALDRHFPEYGFAAHKGYATQSHRAALRRFGPSPFHRKSFRPVSEMLPLPNDAASADAASADAACADVERAFFVALAGAAVEVPSAWREFRQNYHRFSREGTNRALNFFIRNGIALLPSVTERGNGFPAPCLGSPHGTADLNESNH